MKISIVERFDEAWQQNCRNIANIVKERRIILPSTRQLHPLPKSCCWLGKRSWPPTYAKFRASQRGKSGFLGAPMRVQNTKHSCFRDLPDGKSTIAILRIRNRLIVANCTTKPTRWITARSKSWQQKKK